MTDINRVPLYRTIWRWHFYAGLFVIPFILVLSLTGAAYLFKPQLDRWEERAWRDLPPADAVDADAQVAAALAANRGARLSPLPPSRGPRRCRDRPSRPSGERVDARRRRVAAGAA